MAPHAVIFGCEGQELTSWERKFFSKTDPLGFILFARNCDNPEQVAALVAGLRDSVGRADAPVLIDQEGGRVARLKPPHWRAAPAAARFSLLASRDREAGCDAVRLNARLIAEELRESGISVNCAPVLDIPAPGADDVIGDRAFGGGDPSLIADLGRAFCDGLLAGGVLPVIKHIPGHGRARVDTHEALPVVETPQAELEVTDFQPFKALSDMPWAMTAHLVYTAVDPGNPASHSQAVIQKIIRGAIGFDGVLTSDDISMGALEGDYADRAARILAAGCDLVLHCNGEREEMTAVAEGAAALSADTERRLAAAAARLKTPEPIDRKGLATRIDKMLGDL